MLLATLGLGSKISNPSFDIGHIVSSYLFVPALHPSADTYQPILRAGWTLNFEMFFYLIFAISLLAPSRIRIYAACLPIISLTIIGALCDPAGVSEFYTRSVVLSFLYGILIGHFFQNGYFLHQNAKIVFPTLAVMAYIFLASPYSIFGTSQRGIVLGIPAALIVISALALPAPQKRNAPLSRTLASLGDSSYSLYLNHMFTIGIAKIIIQKTFPDTSTAVFIGSILAAVACVAVGHISFLLVEKPIIRFFNRNKETFKANTNLIKV
ncbi:Acyltransferase family protein [compost metagenome]